MIVDANDLRALQAGDVVELLLDEQPAVRSVHAVRQTGHGQAVCEVVVRDAWPHRAGGCVAVVAMVETVDPEIADRIRNVLRKLELLPQGATINLDPKARSSKPEHRPPPGARQNGGKGSAPPRSRNLFEWYRYQFERATDDHRRLFLLYLAERDHLHFVQPLPERRVAGELLKASEAWTKEREAQVRHERDEEILTLGEGMRAEEAAVFFECTWQHVRWLRSRNERDADDGRQRVGKSPRDRAWALKDEGWSVRDIAAHLKVGKSTVHDWLKADRQAA